MRKKTYCVKPNPEDCDAYWKETRSDVYSYDVIWHCEVENLKLYAMYQRARRGL